MRSKVLMAAIAGSVVVLGGAVASAATMHPELGARLSGMGEHGVVNFQSRATQGRLCWTFDLPASGLTGASIRDAHGMAVVRLGKRYSAKGCATVQMRELETIEAKPGSFQVWVDTKAHPGDLRGKLFAGMAHM